MNELTPDELEEQIKDMAAAFPYPPTPDVAGAVHARLSPARRGVHGPQRLRGAAVTVLIFCLLILAAVTAVPQARAALLRILQIGAVQINLLEEPLPAVGEAVQQFSIPDLGREISLEEAANLFTPGDPPFPPALGEPQAVYTTNLVGSVAVVNYYWLPTSERPQILLTQIEIPQMGMKWAAGEQYTSLEIDGRPAAWIEGPHLFDLSQGSGDSTIRTATNVLIWSDGTVTYRLEGDLSQAEALQIAESWK
ncbi:MAG: hypothetical protein ACK2UG_00840 [Candidatus Promineifilaceae bacterium]